MVKQTKVEKDLTRVSKRLDGIHSQLNKLTDTVEFAIKEMAERKMQAERGLPQQSTGKTG